MPRSRQAYFAAKMLDTDGAPVVGITPTVTVQKDGGAETASANAASVTNAKGNSVVLLDAAEMDALSVQVDWAGAGAIGVMQSMPAILPLSTPTGLVSTTTAATVEGAVLATPANKLATGVAGEVTTDTASRDASKADVSNLDVAVSTRMPTTHIAATGGKVDGVATTDVTTDVTNAVTTDTASRDASKADVSNLDAAVSTRMPTTHINATAGKVDGVATTDTTTTNTDMRGTDNAREYGVAETKTHGTSGDTLPQVVSRDP